MTASDFDKFGLRPQRIRELTGTTRGQLRHWEAIGIIAPCMYCRRGNVYRRYSPQQVERVQALQALLRDGYILSASIQKLRQEQESPVNGNMPKNPIPEGDLAHIPKPEGDLAHIPKPEGDLANG